MKIKFDIELTPEELRKLMGMPDWSPLQDEAINQIKAKVLAGDSFDSITLLKPIMDESIQSFTNWQKFMKELMKNGFSQESEIDLTDEEVDDTPN